MIKRKSNGFSWKSKPMLWIFYSLIFIVLLLTIILLFELSIINFPDKQSPRTIVAQDRCSIIAGQLIHTISSEDVCHMQCISTCKVYKLSLVNSNFTFIQDNCNLCSCNCY